jgi:parallel beta-helix repeat protein
MILLALAVLAADPSSLNGVLAAARPGDTVHLVPGSYGTVTIKSKTYAPPLTIDASAANVGTVHIVSSNGIRWTGGTFKGDATITAGAYYGFWAQVSSGITVDSVHISDYRVGIVFDRITGGAVTGNWLSGMASDGIDFSASRGITIAHNACSDFTPAAGAHPDCIQLWSVPGDTPTADMTITANSAVGTMQGISLFNGLKDGVDQGGFDRVSITGNTVLITYGDGISVDDCRGCTVRNNSVGSLPNYMNKAQLYVTGGSVAQCGNTVTMVPRQSTPPCTN